MKNTTSGRLSARKSGSPAPYIPDEGDLVRLDFSPSIGTEQAGPRYGLVVSPRAYNARVGRCHVCPTTGRPRGYTFEVVLPPGLPVYGGILSDQGKPIDWRARTVTLMGKVPQEVLDDVRAKIKAYLAIA